MQFAIARFPVIIEFVVKRMFFFKKLLLVFIYIYLFCVCNVVSAWSTSTTLSLTLQPGFPAYGVVLIIVGCLLALGAAIWAYNYLKNKRSVVQIV